AFFRRNEVYGVEHGGDDSGTHQILTILFRAPKGWDCGIPRVPLRMSPVWWRTLMSLEDWCDFDLYGQRVIGTDRLLQFLENFSIAGLAQRKARSREDAPRRPDTEAEWMETWAAAEDVIRQRAGSGLSADELADAVHVSPAKLRRVFQIARGMSPKEALTKFRIEQAQKLLMHRNLTVTQVAAQVGYSTVQRFCAAFKQISGETPGEFIRRYAAR
ncbi:MAG TPA: helix-turn-helix transcriptional regulator, partial [Planctomycetota bacterium]|nr:helix-turn-helix transcriptional regulator [Planctomycetota bacterium]